MNAGTRCKKIAVVLLGLFADTASGRSFVLPPAGVELVGTVETVAAEPNETLLDVARRHDLGQEQILRANPKVDRWLPQESAEVVLPSSYLLPRTPREGIVLNLPEMRLYYYDRKDENGKPLVVTHPVSVGRMDWTTPLGESRISRKAKDPAWYPPASIREEAAARGETLPDVIPPGPDNPLGRYALYLNRSGYLIHSTNKPYGVGMRVTHGCIRMYPEDIETVFPEVAVGTKVRIINQPIKIGWFADMLFLEVHPPLEEEDQDPAAQLDNALDLVEAELREKPARVSGRAIRQAVEEQKGIPVLISR